MTEDIDAAKWPKLLKDEGKISSDTCLIFDEMYLQKCEEYTGGQLIGAAINGELYKGIVSFMIIGIKQNTPYINYKICTENTDTCRLVKESNYWMP